MWLPNDSLMGTTNSIDGNNELKTQIFSVGNDSVNTLLLFSGRTLEVITHSSVVPLWNIPRRLQVKKYY